MKNNGFTLVELLAVIIILGVIVSITTFGINNVLKQNKQELYEIQLNNILDSAKNWANSNFLNLPENDGEFIIKTLGELKQEGYAKKDIINPKTKELFKDDIQIEIKKVGNNYEYRLIGV